MLATSPKSIESFLDRDLDFSLDLTALSGPDADAAAAIEASIENIEPTLNNSNEEDCPTDCKKSSNEEKAAWTISAGVISAGIGKLISLGYISPEAAIAAGASIAAILLAYKVYEKFNKK